MTRATEKNVTEMQTGLAGEIRDVPKIKSTTGPQGVTPEMKERIESTLAKHHETLQELAKR